MRCSICSVDGPIATVESAIYVKMDGATYFVKTKTGYIHIWWSDGRGE